MLSQRHLERHAEEYASLRKKVLFTIWLLSRPVIFLAAGDRFNISTSSGHNIFKKIVGVLADLMPQYNGQIVFIKTNVWM